MQGMIAVITLGIYFFFGHIPAMAATVFVIMQLGSIAGAAWGTRLRARMDREASIPPLARGRVAH